MNNTDKAVRETGKYELICMSFDGEYQVERPTFDTLDEVANYANDLGSKWYFYPFTFAVTASAKTIADSVFPLDWAKGKRVKTVARIFKAASEKPENQNMNTQTEIRASFWEMHPDFAPVRRTRKRQNDYPALIRCSFVDYVDGLARDGEISEALASRVTL